MNDQETLTGWGRAADGPAETRIDGTPATIGAYRILGVLGEGGMGTVYRAEQHNPQRHVALKVIRPGIATAEHLRRFEQEAEMLGRLQHPGIAQIYEAGTATGAGGTQPYFAMEFIRGLSLTEYASRHDLNMQLRLELMAKICDAVGHAHERGIIHRDLKPSNIMVDEFGQPKILDFGVARVTDADTQATRQTDMGQLIGTLAYMSPEQVLADPLALDTRSDVYALGVILYELLAGRAPYHLDRKPLHEVVQIIREEDPTRLSSINRRYRGDVETIVAKALEKDKTRRYASAGELGADIRRHLVDDPIVARPPSTSYQLQKFARRHKALVIGTAAVFLVLVGGIIAASREAVAARAAELMAEREAASAKAVVDFLQNDLLAQASARVQSGSGARPDPDLKVRTALDRAAARIEGRFESQPEIEAAIRDTIGKTFANLAEYAASQSQLERALALERAVWGPEHPKTLNTQNYLGRTLWHQGKHREAEALLAPALEVERRVLGREHPDTLYCMNNLANAYRSQNKDAQAEPLYRETLDIRRRVLGQRHPDTLISMNNLANVYWSAGNYAEAETLYRQTLETQRAVLGSEHPDALLTMGNLADTLSQQRKHREAEALFRETLELSRRILGPEHTNTLAFLADFASAYERQGRYALAETYYSQVLAGRKRAGASEDPVDVHLAVADLALCYISQRKFAESEPLARENLAFAERELPDRWQRFRAASLLGASLAGQGKLAEAEPLLLDGYNGMLARKKKMWAGNWYHLDRAREWLAELYDASGQPQKAAAFRKS